MISCGGSGAMIMVSVVAVGGSVKFRGGSGAMITASVVAVGGGVMASVVAVGAMTFTAVASRLERAKRGMSSSLSLSPSRNLFRPIEQKYKK